LSISPDGQQIAYTALTENFRQPAIWIRRLGDVKAQAIPGTEGAGAAIFWSPDNRSIAFYAGARLKKISINGGSPTVLAETPANIVGSWNRDGTILFSSVAKRVNPVISRVSDQGGDVTAVTTAENPTQAHLLPQFLPDGRHFLYASVGQQSTQTLVYAASLDSKDIKLVMNSPNTAGGGSVPVYVPPGYLLFNRSATVVAQKFDTKKMSSVGEPVPFLEGVRVSNLAASDNGVLVYRAAAAAPTVAP